MNLKFEDEVSEDLEKIPEEVEIEILRQVWSLEENPLPENSYVIRLPGGTEIQCLKLQEEDRNSKLNHRITYDIKNDDTVRIYGIFNRKPGYEHIKERTERRI